MPNDVGDYRAGYWDARAVIRRQLQKIIKRNDNIEKDVARLIECLNLNEKEEAWLAAQDLCPAITREEYERGLEETAAAIQKKY